MWIPREVFLKFYHDLLIFYREHTLNTEAGEWQNGFGHQHKDDSKEWWLVKRIVNNRTIYPSLEVTASAEIYDTWSFYRIYQKYGVSKIRKQVFEWSEKESRALGAALKYMKFEIPVENISVSNKITKKQFQVLEAKKLFEYYLEYKRLNDDWPNFLIEYPQLKKSLLDSPGTDVNTTLKKSKINEDEELVLTINRDDKEVIEKSISEIIEEFYLLCSEGFRDRAIEKCFYPDQKLHDSIRRQIDRVKIKELSVFDIKHSKNFVGENHASCKVFFIEEIIDYSTPELLLCKDYTFNDLDRFYYSLKLIINPVKRQVMSFSAGRMHITDLFDSDKKLKWTRDINLKSEITKKGLFKPMGIKDVCRVFHVKLERIDSQWLIKSISNIIDNKRDELEYRFDL